MAKGELKDPVLKVHVLHNLGLTFTSATSFLLRWNTSNVLRTRVRGLKPTPKWLALLFAAIGMSFHQLKDYDAASCPARKE